MDTTDLEIRLRNALLQERQIAGDHDNATALDKIIAEIHSMPSSRSRWEDAVTNIVSSTSTNDLDWLLLEDLISQTDLNSLRLLSVLENIVTIGESSPLMRASIYAILASGGKPVTWRRLEADDRLKDEEPLRWLDLALKVVPTTLQAQKIVLDLIEQKKFKVADFARRLDEMRGIGRPSMHRWLGSVVDKFSPSEKGAFDQVIADAFGLNNKPPSTGSQRVDNEEMSRYRVHAYDQKWLNAIESIQFYSEFSYYMPINASRIDSYNGPTELDQNKFELRNRVFASHGAVGANQNRDIDGLDLESPSKYENFISVYRSAN